MESQPLLVHTHIVRKNKNKLYCCYALISIVIISAISGYFTFPNGAFEPLEKVALYNKELPTQPESFSKFDIHYRGNGLSVESEISFAEIQETKVQYDVLSNDPNCMEHLEIKEGIAGEKLDISLSSDYTGFYHPQVKVYITVVLPSFVKLDEFRGEGGLIWNGQGEGSNVDAFTSNSDFLSVNVKNLFAGDLKITANSGSITISDVTAKSKVALKSSFGSILIERVTAEELSAIASSGSIKWNNLSITGKTNLESSYGSIKGRTIKSSDFTTKTSSGSIEISDAQVGGDIFASTTFGSIGLNDLKCGTLVASASSGGVRSTLIQSKHAVDIQSSFGTIDVDIEFTDSKIASANLQATSGTVSGRVLNYKSLDATSNYGSIKLDATPSKKENSSTNFKADSGSIKSTFYDYEGQFDASTSSGSISIDGDVEYIVDKSQKKSGLVGDGTDGTLVAHSTHGSIKLYFK
ncbi:hypothetical protein HDV01_002991 [Terramyces sp. JEL0728]|nr:hypothetical protein HDV01_002991 [Terramyces sp. JEL0728]